MYRPTEWSEYDMQVNKEITTFDEEGGEMGGGWG